MGMGDLPPRGVHGQLVSFLELRSTLCSQSRMKTLRFFSHNVRSLAFKITFTVNVIPMFSVDNVAAWFVSDTQQIVA